MNVKVTLLTTFLLICTTATWAQYQPITVEGRSWNVYTQTTFLGNFTLFYEMGKDTVVQGKLLVPLYELDSNGARISIEKYIKEEPLTKRITYYNPSNLQDSISLVLSTPVGNAVSFLNICGDTSSYVIDSISTITDNLNNSRTRYHLRVSDSNGQSQYFTFTEGFGSSSFTQLIPITCIIIEASFETLCIKESGGTSLYNNPNYASCTILSTKESVPVEHVKLYPNPSNNWLYFTESALIQSIEVYDNSGKKVVEILDMQQNKLNISNLKNGQYIVQLSFRNGTTTTNKIVVQKP